ncbi:hypothetical protein GU700_07210 [Methylobacterium sp. NI91]|nr:MULTISPECIES: hypothetical protein [unclassified Methylobacterium]QIJ74384.1 hypothetical protein CLZ_07210 [Methylobacterium sp. CLZ]QIJ79290.1 hypothetical protein GU700_07210 [Methylobacterium sp. NI91]
MAHFPSFTFTTLESWFGELSFKAAEDSRALSLAGREFEMHITQVHAGAMIVAPMIILTMEIHRGLTLKQGDPRTLVFCVPKTITSTFLCGEYTADVFEVAGGERHLFMPVRIKYTEPSGRREFLMRFFGVTVSFGARQQTVNASHSIPGRERRSGATIMTSTVPPVFADGKDGDYFIEDRTAVGRGRRMYGPKADSVWPDTPWTIQVAAIADVPGAGSAAALGVSTVEQAEQADRDDVVLTPAKGRTLLSALLGATFVPGTLGSTLRRLSDWFNDEVNARSFGAIGDGVSRPLSNVFSSLALARVVYPRCLDLGETTDTAAIREAIYAALAQGKAAYIPGGRYRINRQITPNTYNAGFNNLRILGDGKGITILQHDIVAHAGIGWMFGATGGLTPTQVISSPILQGAQSVTLPNISNYAPGNYIQLTDLDQPILDHRDDSIIGYCGENLRIRSVDALTKSLTLHGSTEFAYGPNTTAARLYPVRGFSAEGFTVRNEVAGSGGQGALVFKLDAVENLRLKDIEFENLDDDGVRISNVIGFEFLDMSSRDLNNNLGFTPYMFNINAGCQDGLITRCRTRRGRHIVTSSCALGIEPSYVIVAHCHSTESSSAAYDQHPGGGRHWIFDSCQAHQPDIRYGEIDATGNPGLAGFQLRGRKTIVINPQVSGFPTGIYLVFGENNTVLGGELDRCGDGVRIRNSPGSKVKGTKISYPTNNGVVVARGTGLARMGNIVVEDIDVTGNPTGYAIDFGTSWDESNRVERVRAPQVTRKFNGVPHAHTYGRFSPGVPLPNNAKFQTLDPRVVDTAALAGLTSGTMLLAGIEIEHGELIATASMLFSSAGVRQTNLWCALFDKDRNLLGATNDLGTSVITAGIPTIFTFVCPIRTLHKGRHYLGVVSVANTPPSFRGRAISPNVGSLAPALLGYSNTGLTNPASAPAKAVTMTPTSNMPYAFLS